MATLQSIDQEPLPKNAVIRFSHSHPLLANNPLYVRSGANAIKWAYHLNTSVIPTYGGEVVQILSCVVGPISIEGNVAGRIHPTKKGTLDPDYTPNEELKDIADWFLTYMHIAGTVGTKHPVRDETAVLMEYPARGWSFYIQPTQLNGFRYAVDQPSPTWQIVAEIVADNDRNQLAVKTMESMTDAVTSNQILSRMQRFANIGFDPNSPWIDPLAAQNATTDLKKFGDNFKALLGAWSSGDFSHFGFFELKENVSSLTEGQKQYWTTLFGQDFINLGGPSNNTGQTGGGAVITGDINSKSKPDIVNNIASIFKSHNLAPDMGVATAMNESGLNPDARQQGGDFAMGLFQTFPSGAGGGQAHADEVKKAFANKSDPVTQYYPPGDQMSDAAGWFSHHGSIDASASDHQKAVFAQAAQGAGDPDYITKIENLLPQARALIKQYADQAPSGVRGDVLQQARDGLGKMNYSQGTSRNWRSYKKGQWPTTDCSGYVTLCYAWGTNYKEAYDPNQSNWNGGYTGTMLAASNGNHIAKEKAQAGDIVVYTTGAGDGHGHHVAIFLEAWNGGGTALWSHGGGIGAKRVTWDSELAAQANFGADHPVVINYLG